MDNQKMESVHQRRRQHRNEQGDRRSKHHHASQTLPTTASNFRGPPERWQRRKKRRTATCLQAMPLYRMLLLCFCALFMSITATLLLYSHSKTIDVKGVTRSTIVSNHSTAFAGVNNLQARLVPSTPHMPVPAPRLLPPLAELDTTTQRSFHFVHTRFMQNQGPLQVLGMARLNLFKSACFPTIVRQFNGTQQEGDATKQGRPSNQSPFLWIITTDPDLDRQVREQLTALLRPYPHFYLIASNDNLAITNPDTGSDTTSGTTGTVMVALDKLLQLTQSAGSVWVGDAMQLRQVAEYIQGTLQPARNIRYTKKALISVLETRLDADDGIHPRYLEFIQEKARQDLLPAASKVSGEAAAMIHTKRWMVYCIKRHAEWHLQDGSKTFQQDEPNPNPDGQFPGMMVPVEHSKLCVTPGLTIAFLLGVNEKEARSAKTSAQSDNLFPVFSHDQIYKKLSTSIDCLLVSKYQFPNDDHSKQRPLCIEMIQDPIFLFAAIRSRTVTSAGMMDINQKKATPKQEVAIWTLVRDRFGLDTIHTMPEARGYVFRHAIQIAYENWLGQCTAGHSCKEKAMRQLQEQFHNMTDNPLLERRYPDLEQALQRRQSERRQQQPNMQV